jgi:glycosyltransferase involved in cell wall biosynthesis
MPPRVSIIIRTYNRAHLIPETILSVLVQTFQDFEIIAIDDGSTDDTRAVLKRFKDKRIRYVYQTNRGQSAALNTGLRLCDTDYVAILDSDDLWLPEMLETAVNMLDSKPNAALFYAKASSIDADGKPLTQILGAPEKFPGHTFKSLLYGDCVAPGTVVLRRKFVETIGLFDEALNGTEDWDMWVRIARYYPFAYADRTLARYRCHEANYTSIASNFRHLVQARTQVLDKVFSGSNVPEEALSIKPVAYRNVYMDIGLRWLSVAAWRESARYFWRAVRVSPNPLTTPFRLLWLILFNNVFRKTRWGSRLISRLVDLRRGWRADAP